MIAVSIQTLTLCFAGLLVWFLWRRFAAYPPLVRGLVAAGFLGRAVIALVLFWISYGRLPVFEHLQMGNGFWFFASDGVSYFERATALAAAGPMSILQCTRSVASVAYVQALALLMLALGRVAAVGLLLNLACYLATCLMLLKWGAASSSGYRATLLATAFISLSPSAILWSVQPLKDAFFTFLIVAFVVACAAWQRAWREEAWLKPAVMAAIVMIAAIFNLAGVRWYYAFVVFICCALFLAMVAMTSPGRRRASALAAVALVPLLGTAFLTGAGPYVPESIRKAMLPGTIVRASSSLPGVLLRDIETFRSGFQSTGGATTIALGKKLAPMIDATRVETRIHHSFDGPPVSVADNGSPDATKSDRAAVPAPKAASVASSRAVQGDVSSQALLIPQSVAGRFLLGAAAVVLPRSIAQRLGIFEISGGHGLWLFADVDTVVFDLAILSTIIAVVRRRAGLTARNGVAWLVISTTLAITIPLIYTVTNFGTLFRLREMIFVGLVMAPIAAAAGVGRTLSAGNDDRVVSDFLPGGERCLVVRNIDPAVVNGFGDEWSRFDQLKVADAELRMLFHSYFRIFPWAALPPDAVGFDAGCGSGRWARLVARRVGKLICVDASADALAVARRNLSASANCEFHVASIDAMPIEEGSTDFGYSLGVLHHVPDTPAGIRSCVSKLKRGAPFLIYLYYALDNRPFWFRAIWRLTNGVRAVISRAPHWIRYAASQLIAAVVYWPLARFARTLERLGARVEGLPLSQYRDRSFYVMRTDALDRFGTRLEQRFTRAEIERMMSAAGLTDIRFSDQPPFWCAVGIRA